MVNVLPVVWLIILINKKNVQKYVVNIWIPILHDDMIGHGDVKKKKYILVNKM